MNLLFKVIVIGLVLGVIVASPVPQNEEGNGRSWWQNLVYNGWDVVSGAIKWTTHTIYDLFSAPVKGFFDQLFTSGNDELTQQAELVLGDESATHSQAEEIILHGEHILEFADNVKQLLTSNDTADDERESLMSTISKLVNAGNSVIHSGESILNKADNLTTILVKSVEFLNDSTVSESVEAVGDEVRDTIESVQDASLALGELLTSFSDLKNNLNTDQMMTELTDTGKALWDAGSSLNTLYQDIKQLGGQIISAGITITKTFVDEFFSSILG